jgi:UPF0042 nucleotide-binding protein
LNRLVIITGLSGSGKSLAARCLEDLGFFCVDNLPVQLIPPFYELIHRSGEPMDRAALVIDVREGHFLDEFPEILRQLRERGAPVALLFFESSDDILKRRFSETRRPHPMGAEGVSLEAAIRREREALSALRDLADRIIDTSRFTAHELRAFLQGSYGGSAGPADMNVHVVSFGFKYGVPAESDLMFDVRCLPNPYFVDQLRPLDGRSREVREFLDEKPEAKELTQRFEDLLGFLLPLYVAEGKSYLTVSIGCTGGKHRSVAIGEDLVRRLAARGVTASVYHRDLGRE